MHCSDAAPEYSHMPLTRSHFYSTGKSRKVSESKKGRKAVTWKQSNKLDLKSCACHCVVVVFLLYCRKLLYAGCIIDECITPLNKTFKLDTASLSAN